MEDFQEKIIDIWDRNVEQGDQYTLPWLNVTDEEINQLKTGIIGGLHNPVVMFPQNHPMVEINKKMHGNLKNKKLLCLASGGGQQSAIYSLLGADVTVFDLNENQLKSDQLAANHYGYKVRTIQGDMRKMSMFDDDEFDLIYHPISACFLPELKTMYQEVYRILKKGGKYMVEHIHPATYPTTYENGKDGWDGVGYRISTPYICGPILIDDNGLENMENGEPTGEHRHSLLSIFGDLINSGFIIENVWEDGRHFPSANQPEPGSEEHFAATVQLYFNILARK